MGVRLQAWWIALREWLVTGWPLVLIAGLGFWAAFQFVEPAPPRHLVLTTGREDGAYYTFAKRYQEIFARNGIELEIRTSSGSLENLKRLQAGEADIAFVQGGDYAEAGEGLLSLGSVFYEPIWVFVRGRQPPDRLTALAGWRIGIGQEGSGVRALASQLLAANELSLAQRHAISLGGLEAAEALQQGRLDALFVIAAPEAPIVQVLLRSPGIQVMSFAQAEAYRRQFPYLSRLILPEGGVDLVRNYPPRDTQLLATTANLVVRDDLHPALLTLMLNAAREVHGGSGFFHAAGEFPAYKDSSFPLAAGAARFYQSGPPFLQRYLPFWLAVLVDRFLVLALPLFALLLPLLRLAPTLYAWRIRSRICRCYGELKFLENDIKRHYADPTASPQGGADFRRRLDEIESVANGLSIPLAFTDLLYTLREHINLVRKALDRYERERQAADCGRAK
ncbi:MAG: ABC transporter substrate-binding protein [Azovibrio sp.]|nr:ABC transporter substrate-binding protein [Azovibrio sp.]